MRRTWLVPALATAVLGAAPSAAAETATASPTSATIQTRSLASGTPADLATDDGVFYEVNSKTSSTFKTDWYGSFTGIPNELTGLTVSYQGRNSRSCTQTISIRNWNASSWVQLDSQKVGTTEVTVERVPTNTLSRYVSGSAGPGELRLRVKCSTTGGRFVASGDLMTISYGGGDEDTGDELPNLVPLKPRNIRIGSADEGDASALRLTVSTANRGLYSLDLSATPSTVVPETSDAYQCVLWATERLCQERRAVGSFIFHAAHNHYHFDDYALYELRRINGSAPDMSAAGLVSPGIKASFCLIDYERDGNPPSPVYDSPYYEDCSTSDGDGIQGISPGWRDTYGSNLAGQQIPIDGVSDGDYAVVITADPKNRLWESGEADNVSYRLIRLQGGSVSYLS